MFRPLLPSIRRFSTAASDEEMRLFNKHSKDWWNTSSGPFAILHQFNKVRVPFIINKSLGYSSNLGSQTHYRSLEGKSVIDVGCGGGILSAALADQGATVLGIDIGAPAIQAAQEHVTAKNPSWDVKFRNCNVNQIVEEKRTFDIVVASEVIEHVDDVPSFFDSLTQLVSPNGVLVLSTVNRTPESYALAIVAAERILRVVPAGTHEWNRFVAPEQLKALGRGHDLRCTGLQGVTWIPFVNSFIPIPCTRVNYMIAFSKQ